MKDEKAKTRLWNEHLDLICEKDSWGNRPCDTYGYCMCAISCNEDWFIKAFAIKLKEAGLDYSWYEQHGYLHEE